ncbi:hypothetical protein FJ364_04375, partial [Candidatus Dependentiae bacterium]|nr:hypothetical protein [Candidatus Dependentiae bacterium]
MNIKSLFIICALSMSLFFQGCSNKQHIPPANTNTAQLPTDAMPMLTEKKAVKPAQTHFDITTQAGFLGKSENSKAYDAAMIKTLNEDYEKKLASTSKYYDFKFEVHNVSGV